MLYEETETRFKGAKLVLTPDRSQDAGKRGPPSPSPSPSLPFTNPLKAATVIKDEEQCELLHTISVNCLLNRLYFVQSRVICILLYGTRGDMADKINART